VPLLQSMHRKHELEALYKRFHGKKGMLVS
jgi:hypothetical protein